MKLLVATQNPGKIREFETLLGPLGTTLLSPTALNLALDVVEDGESYVENACKKASAYSHASGLVTLGDDSGLEVDALGGAPGIHSARYAPGSDEDRVTALLRHLEGIPESKRTARFRCVVAVCSEQEVLVTAEGICEGLIAHRPMGEHGFGYDPIFWLPDYRRTMAQLPGEIKNRVSHRARAVQAVIPALQCLIRNRERA